MSAAFRAYERAHALLLGGGFCAGRRLCGDGDGWEVALRDLSTGLTPHADHVPIEVQLARHGVVEVTHVASCLADAVHVADTLASAVRSVWSATRVG